MTSELMTSEPVGHVVPEGAALVVAASSAGWLPIRDLAS